MQNIKEAIGVFISIKNSNKIMWANKDIDTAVAALKTMEWIEDGFCEKLENNKEYILEKFNSFKTGI